MQHFAIAAAVAALALPLGAQAQEAEALMKKNGCLKCHSVSAEKDGPAYKAVAAKYKGKADAAATLSGMLKSGKVGAEKHAVFKGSDAELKQVVDYILSR